MLIKPNRSVAERAFLSSRDEYIDDSSSIISRVLKIPVKKKMFRDRRKTSRTSLSRRLFGNRHMNYQTNRMFRAIRNNQVSVVKLLFKSGKVDFEAREGYPGNGYLHLSAYLANVAITKLLLKTGCRVNACNSKHYTPLHLALHLPLVPLADRINVIQALLDNGSNVNATNSIGDTPLHVMARSNACHVKVITLLLKYGADLNRTNNEGKTPFHEYIFAQESWFGVDRTLLELLLPADEVHGLSPMHEACLFHEWTSVEEMVKNGAEVDVKDKFGRTPLYYAVVARKKNEEKKSVVRLLLDYGADINQKFTERRFRVENLVVDLAFNLRDSETLEIFLEHLAKLLVVVSSVSSEYRLMYCNFFRYMHIEAFEVSSSRSVSEIRTMRTSMLLGSISFFDLLKAESKKAMLYARNRRVVEAFEASGYETRFPMFRGTLRANFDRGSMRLKLVEEAAVLLSDVLEFADFSHPIFEMILLYYSDEDLKVLIQSA